MRFSLDPNEERAQSIICIARYLRDTRDKGMILHPHKDKSFEFFANADFSGLWNKDTASEDVSITRRFRVGRPIAP